MDCLRRRLNRIVWIALIAILGNTLAPVAVNALAAAGGASQLTEICTAMGTVMVMVRLDSDSPDAKPAAGGSGGGGHCALCGHPAQAGAPPSPDTSWPFTARVAVHVPWLFLHAPSRLFAWSTAQPRAPPLA